MNKSTFGMILLVGMVITKAVISVDQKEQTVFVVKSDVVSETPFTRNFVAAQPAEELLAATIIAEENVFIAPAVPNLNQTNYQVSNVASISYDQNEELAEDVKPLDANSNTGYGRWMGDTESSEKVDESTPLDNGNTITENISRLFPRSH